MSSQTPEQLVARGLRAKEIVNDPVFTEAWEILRRSLSDAIPLTKAHESAERERLYVGLTVLGELHSAFNTVINTGSVTQAKINAIKTKRA